MPKSLPRSEQRSARLHRQGGLSREVGAHKGRGERSAVCHDRDSGRRGRAEASSATQLALEPRRFDRYRSAKDRDLAWGTGAKRGGLGTLILESRLRHGT